MPLPWSVELPDTRLAPHRRSEFLAYLHANGRNEDDYAAAELIFGELTGNAYLHAPGACELAVEWSRGHATLHVTDEGVPIDLDAPSLPPDPLCERGRGLALVKAFAPSVHTTSYPGFGKTISVALPVRANSS